MFGNSSLDSLATNGIIDFDANAFVKGTPPRFFGSPGNNAYGGQSYGVTPGSRLNGEPENDAFVKREKEHTPPNWLSMLTGSLVAALGVFGIVKAKSILDVKKAKEKAEVDEFDDFDEFDKFDKVKEAPEAKKGILTKIKDGISSVFKSKENTKNTEKAAKDVAKKAGFWAKHPKLKVTGIGALTLLGLYGLYEVVGKPKHQAPAQEE